MTTASCLIGTSLLGELPSLETAETCRSERFPDVSLHVFIIFATFAKRLAICSGPGLLQGDYKEVIRTAGSRTEGRRWTL